MTCTLCEKTALMAVGKKGFCGDHKAEAVAAMKSLGDRKTGSGYTVWTPEQRSQNAARSGTSS